MIKEAVSFVCKMLDEAKDENSYGRVLIFVSLLMVAAGILSVLAGFVSIGVTIVKMAISAI